MVDGPQKVLVPAPPAMVFAPLLGQCKATRLETKRTNHAPRAP